MAKKINKETNEVSNNKTKLEVTNCDLKQIDKAITKSDNPDDFEVVINQNDIEKLIIMVRGEQVLIDQDVAKLYYVTTKRLNQQANRNSERFPSSFRFTLTEAERDEVVANCNHLKSLKYRPTLPYAFTEQGIGQLSTVLHSKKAIETSIKIMNAFVAMRRFMIQNAAVLIRIAHLEKHQIETDEKIDLILDKIEDISPKPLPEQIFPTGCVWDAWAYISDLVRDAKQRIILIDNFVDDRVLSMFTKRANGVSATIHSRYNEQFLTDLKKHNTQYPEIEFIQLPHRNHDRFLIIDDKVYFIGASLKDIGSGLCGRLIRRLFLGW